MPTRREYDKKIAEFEVYIALQNKIIELQDKIIIKERSNEKT